MFCVLIDCFILFEEVKKAITKEDPRAKQLSRLSRLRRLWNELTKCERVIKFGGKF